VTTAHNLDLLPTSRSGHGRAGRTRPVAELGAASGWSWSRQARGMILDVLVNGKLVARGECVMQSDGSASA
jgi:hypothetical protein